MLEPVVLEDCRILFRNFKGEEGRYNSKGVRNFNVALDDVRAITMEDAGWNVKYLQPRDEADLPQAILLVTVHFGKNPPRIVMITSKGQTRLDEETCGVLDWAQIKYVDMIVRPYEWEVNGKTGVKAYLRSIYVTIIEDELELKYRDVPDSAESALQLVREEETEGPPWQVE